MPGRGGPALALVVALMLIAGGGLVVPQPGASRGPWSAPPGSGESSGPPGADHPATGRDAAPGVDPTEPARWPAAHEVAPGETLGEIADRYGLAAGRLARANSLADAALLRPGDVLALPDPQRPTPRTARSAVAEAPDLARLLEETAHAFGWRPATVKAVAWEESRWDHGRVSHRGAVGVMQVQPATADAMSERLGRDLDPYDLEDNVVAGVAYLDWLHDVYDGDVRRILTAYVQGPQRLADEGPVPEAQRYVDRVLRWRDVFAAGAHG